MRKIRRRFDLQGRDELELERRIDALRAALSLREGKILRITSRPDADTVRARVLYEVELPDRVELAAEYAG